MSLLERLGQEALFVDGGMGTMLQRAGIPRGMAPDLATLHLPEVVKGVHRAYVEAGSRILTANTFGANALKLTGTGCSVAEIAAKAVALAREALEGETGYVAMDIGPSGKLLAPLGDLDFEDAYRLFREMAEAGKAAGADLILVETMEDLYELKAAVLAAVETGLPVFATVTVDREGKLLTGADMETVAALLTGLGVSALGLNCGFGADRLLPCLKRLRASCGLPLILSPNAGMPRRVQGETVYSQTPGQFAAHMAQAALLGASVFGGCCGTTPEHIAAMVGRLAGFTPQKIDFTPATVVTSGSRAVTIGGPAPVLIGERINPTGKPAMKRALKENSDQYMLREAVRQQEAGVHILDVNVGLPGIDEAVWLARLVPAIQAVSDLPLQLDTANPAALEGALRRYNGKAMINSVSGKRESMEAVFPLVQKYGGVVVALTLDEEGIPDTAEGRMAIAERILDTAAGYGIGKEDIVIDPLTMAVSAEPGAALAALEALRRIRSELGTQTVLGVSNISFGLPKRDVLNAAFFTLAAGAGLSAAIINPFAEDLMRAYAALGALLGAEDGLDRYMEAMQAVQEAKPPAASATGTLRQAVRHGLRDEARSLAAALSEAQSPLAIVETELIPALDEAGEAFAKGTLFLPQLLMCAEAAKAAFDALERRLAPGERGGRGTVVIATVKGDIHDIGKNIAKALLQNYRFDVVDLGRDVKPEAVLDAVKNTGARLVGLSALMTTTVVSMEETIALLRQSAPDVKIMAGGAVLSREYAEKIGADRYVKDAMESVRFAEEVLGEGV